MSKVAIIKCASYDEVFNAIKRAVNLLGGIEKFIGKDDKVLLKPNLLAAKSPNKAVTTHPAVFEAMIKILDSYKLTYGDSPGFGGPVKASSKAGLKEIADKYKIPLTEFRKGKLIHFKEGHVCKQFEVAKGVIDADSIVSISKMKTHQLTRITGAVKNQLGCVFGLNKGAFHAKFPDAISFSKMLIDLNLLLKPKLYVMDGIIAMEGNGPASGNPVRMNVILMSDNPVAIDTAFCKLIDLNPKQIPTNIYGQEYGLGSYKDIEYVGDAIEPLINKSFDISRNPVIKERLGAAKFLRKLMLRKPIIDESICIKCGICIRACPVDALEQEKGKVPVYNYNKCIRCYCCQEMCPQKAIYVKTPLFGRLILYRKK